MSVSILIGDCRARLKELPDESVHACVTSPPYFGLRDYGITGQIGLEQTPEEFVAELVEVFREVRRVLRNDGTLWLNLGDSYAGSGKGQWNGGAADPKNNKTRGMKLETQRPSAIGLKPKDLIGIPWRVAFALQADGWYLRQDIIWSKPNPMPESVTDRFTKSHEYIFLFSKSAQYYFDQEAILEEASASSFARLSHNIDQQKGSARAHDGGKINGNMKAVSRSKDTVTSARSVDSRPHSLSKFEADNARNYPVRNKRSVWTVTTQPFKQAHFATFPPALIEPCILAGCPEGGTVLDPFGGAGTTGLVADRLGRSALLIELNPEYADIAERRIHGDSPLFSPLQSQAVAE